MRQRILGKAIVKQGGSGTIRWAIEAHGSALALFKPSERNDMVREALVDGGKFYISVFVPMNFTAYAERKGYDVSGKYYEKKLKLARRGVIDGPLPLVYTGATRESALTKSTASGTATANRATVIMRIPIPPHSSGKGYGIAKIVGAVLRSIMPWEVQRVAEVVEDSLLRALQGRIEKAYSNPDSPPVRRPQMGDKRRPPVGGRPRDNAGRYLRSRN